MCLRKIKEKSSAIAETPRDAVISFNSTILQAQCFISGRPAPSAACRYFRILFLVRGPKIGFLPRRGNTLPG